MENKIVSPPTPQIQKAAEVIESGIVRFLNTRDTTITSWGKYESDGESITLYHLVIRNIEAITALAKLDLVLLPAAMGLARTAFEIAVKILWILNPSDPFDRELRWLVHLQEKENYYERISRFLRKMGVSDVDYVERKDSLREFRTGVISVLPTGYEPLKQLPNLREMLISIGQEIEYARYIDLSQYTHGTHVATRVYRKNSGTLAQYGEFISPKDWYLILETCRFCIFYPGSIILEKLGGDKNKFLTPEYVFDVQKTLEELR